MVDSRFTTGRVARRVVCRLCINREPSLNFGTAAPVQFGTPERISGQLHLPATWGLTPGVGRCQNAEFSEAEYSALQNEHDPAHQDRGLRYVL